MAEKLPRPGKNVKVYVFKDSSKKVAAVYMGAVQEGCKKKTFSLGGFYEDTTPLLGCGSSGRFHPLRKDLVTFPLPNTPPDLTFWKKIPCYPTTVGQHFVYVDRRPTPFTVVSMSELTGRPSAKNLMCLIGGTHSFYATDFGNIEAQLKAGDLLAFPEYTQSIYTDMMSFLRGTAQRKALHAMAELKLCV